MPGTGQFSVATAAALVLGGIAAAILATAIALNHSTSRDGAAAARASGSPSAAPRPSAARDADEEILLDVSELGK